MGIAFSYFDGFRGGIHGVAVVHRHISFSVRGRVDSVLHKRYRFPASFRA
jgi:hypothetical protein